MGLGTLTAPAITLKGESLKPVDKFVYLGSTISASLDAEINARIGKAASAFGKLSKRVWDNGRLTIRTKTLVYQTCVLTTLLYGCETWTTYAKQERKLNSFHQRCLRRLLKVSWSDRVSNEEVLKRTKQAPIQSILGVRRLRWLGHVHRMPNYRLPKQVLYGELKEGQRKRGRQLKRFKDLCNSNMKDYGIEVDSWQNLASDRPKWRTAVKKGANQYYTKKALHKIEKKSVAPPPQSQSWPCNYCNKVCKSQIGLHSHTRKCSRTTTS